MIMFRDITAIGVNTYHTEEYEMNNLPGRPENYCL